MPMEIRVPRLGWSMEEGVFVEWLKAEGDSVSAGDQVFVLEGEKAAHEIESFDSGVLCIPADAPQPGETVHVGQVIGFLLAPGESRPATVRSSQMTPPDRAASPAAMQRNAAPATTSTRVAGPAARRLARQLGVNLDSISTPDPTGRVTSDDVRRAADASLGAQAATPTELRRFATPRARRKAQELGVDWHRISGTGRRGRIRERDVTTYAFQTGARVAPPDAPAAPGRLQPLSAMRRTIAQRMSAGMQQTAPVTLTTKVDAAELVALRARLKAESSADTAPSYRDILVKFVAETLPECPLLNACWRDNGVFLYDEINIAVAVETPQGLMAPVLRQVPNFSLREVSAQSRALIAQAQAGALTASQLQGGTFTISNLGMYEIDFFTPVLNLPQSAILGLGRIVREPVVRQDRVVVGETLGLSLTFDHRVLDGAPAARWLQGLAQRIRQPMIEGMV
jgi:pyruvate dehydrogenase E2 component (dihydrolipoamide acetyltransferase)